MTLRDRLSYCTTIFVLVVACLLPVQSEATASTKLYVGQTARLTAIIPSTWTPDETLKYDYAGHDGFIASWPVSLPASVQESLDAACERVSRQELFGNAAEIEITTWRESPACVVRSTSEQANRPAALVFANPVSTAFGPKDYVAVVVDADDFEEVTSSISFDLSAVTSALFLDSTIDYIATHSLWRDGEDWPVVRSEAQKLLKEPNGNSLSAAVPAIQFVLERVKAAGGDGHNWLSPPTNGASLPTYLYIAPTGTQLADGIGYLNIPGFLGAAESGNQFATEIRTILAGEQDESGCGWIVDLRQNNGGNMYPMLTGLTPLLGAGTGVGFRDVTGISRFVVVNQNETIGGNTTLPGESLDSVIGEGAPAIADAVSEQPVAVLIGPGTGSSGEAIAIAFASRDRTGFFGETTFGVPTSPTYLRLLDGSLLSVATHWTTGPQGAIYPGGLRPDAEIPLTNLVYDAIGDDPVVQAATAWLGEQTGCSPNMATPVPNGGGG